jgi:RNA polymerase sigma-70 factor (ECF subfamily)
MPRFDTLNPAWMVWDGPAPAPEEAVLEYPRELEKFLAEIERRAFRMAQIALRDPDDALDVVQDAMLKLARNYAARPSAEMAAVVLSNHGKRHPRSPQRRRSVRKRFATWLPV